MLGISYWGGIASETVEGALTQEEAHRSSLLNVDETMHIMLGGR